MKRSKGFRRVYQLQENHPYQNNPLLCQLLQAKVPVIKLIVDQLCSMEVPKSKRMVVTGPDPRTIDVCAGGKARTSGS